MLALLTLYSLQAADLETVRLCVPAPEGHVTAELGFVRTDGVWWTPPPDAATSRQRFDASTFPTARSRNWFIEKTPIKVGTATFSYVGQHQASWAFNRYYLEHPPVDGVGAVVPLGAPRDTLLILSDPIGCGFAKYSVQQEP